MKARPVEEIARVFTALHHLGIRDRDTYSAVLRGALEANPQTFGVWSVWEPDAFDGRDAAFQFAPGHDASGRFIPYWHRAHGYPKLAPVTGYEKPGPGNWYWVPKQKRQLCSMEPYLYPVGGRYRLITGEVAPIVSEGRCLGVTGIDFLAQTSGGTPPDSPRIRHPTVPVIHVADSSPGQEALSHLTAREREVHYWLSQGKSNEEIGLVLGISAHTVKNHLERIFQKLGVENRYAAALTFTDRPLAA